MPCKCSSQIFFRFSKARMEVGVIPATYSRSSHKARLRRREAGLLWPLFPATLLLLRPRGADGFEVAIDGDSFFPQCEAVHAHVMSHPAALQKVQCTDTLLTARNVAQHEPAIHQRGDADGALLDFIPKHQVRKHGGHALVLEKVNKTSEHRFNRALVAYRNEICDGVDHNYIRLKLLHFFVHLRQMRLQPSCCWARCMDFE